MGARTILSREQRDEIRKRSRGGETAQALAAEFNVSTGTIQNVRNRIYSDERVERRRKAKAS